MTREDYEKLMGALFDLFVKVPLLVAFTILFYSLVLWFLLSLLNIADLTPLFYFKEVFAGVFILQAFLGIRRCLIENPDERTLVQRLVLGVYTAAVYVVFAGLLAAFF